jgi:hypothetical protein
LSGIIGVPAAQLAFSPMLHVLVSCADVTGREAARRPRHEFMSLSDLMHKWQESEIGLLDFEI